MMVGRRAVVVGAGIGGLTAAVALQRRGWDVTVAERAPALEPVGAGLGLGPNALHALDAIGLGDEVRRFSAVQGHGGLRRSGGGWLVRTDLGAVAARFGDPQLVALRADVVGLLAGSLPAGVLRTGVTVTGVDAGDAGRRARVATSAGDLDADLVVAADGIGSRIRAALFPHYPGPRYSGFTTWRFVAPAVPAGAGGARAAPGTPAETAPDLAAYTTARLSRTRRVADGSYRATRLSGMTAPAGTALRNTGIRLAGRLAPGLMLRQMDPIASWTPPL